MNGRLRIPLARCQNRDGLIHAVTDDLEAALCNGVGEYAIIGYDTTSEITCRVCLKALEKSNSVCTDCGARGQGSLCPACRAFQSRNPGQRRGRQRKPVECTFLLDRTDVLYQRYQNNESMESLAKEAGVCGHTLKKYFKQNGYALRGKKKAGKARSAWDKTLSAQYPVHPQAKEKEYSVSPAEDRLIIAIQQLNLEGIKPTATLLFTMTDDYASTAVIYDVLSRLRRRGFLDGTQLTKLAWQRECRPDAQERMTAVYQPGMHSGDLSRSAGVSVTCANIYIKTHMVKTAVMPQRNVL
jgi:hypothetical protein